MSQDESEEVVNEPHEVADVDSPLAPKLNPATGYVHDDSQLEHKATE